MTEGHGDDIYRYGCRIEHNFSTNVYAGFDHSALFAHLASVAGSIANYPEPTPASVERLLAHNCCIAPECVMVTNGATEAIYLIAQWLRGKRSAVVSPTFSEYEDACRIHGHSLRFISSIGDVPEDVDAVWLCNPNNPTGSVTPRDELLELVRDRQDTVFVIDQAYADYTAIPLIREYEAVELPNVLLLGSLTKRFAIPGLRIGYAVGNAALMSRIRSLRMPWSVNQLAIEGANYLLAHEEDYPIDAGMLHREALRMARAFEAMGITVKPTDCNFILCSLPAKASGLKDYLAETHGILIRDASNFRGLTPHHFRVAALTPAQNDLLITAIREWAAKNKIFFDFY